MPSTPTTDPRSLPEIEHELDALLVRYTDLEAARLKMMDVLERVHAGDEVDAVLTRMGELQAAIAAAPAKDITLRAKNGPERCRIYAGGEMVPPRSP